MPTTKTTTRRAAGSLAVDRIEYRKTDRRTAKGNKPVTAVYVDDVELGEVAKAAGSGWLYAGEGVKPPGFYLPDTKDEAAAKLVDAALDAGKIRDMDDAAMDVAMSASAAVSFPDHHETPSVQDQTDARTAAGYLALRVEVGPGDYVIRPDGRRCRVGMRHEQYGPNKYQPTVRPASVQLTDGGSWWLGLAGDLGNYSGSFDGRVDVADLEDTGERALGSAQMWRDRTPGGGNAFVALVPVKVWRVRTGAESYSAR